MKIDGDMVIDSEDDGDDDVHFVMLCTAFAWTYVRQTHSLHTFGWEHTSWPNFLLDLLRSCGRPCGVCGRFFTFLESGRFSSGVRVFQVQCDEHGAVTSCVLLTFHLTSLTVGNRGRAWRTIRHHQNLVHAARVVSDCLGLFRQPGVRWASASSPAGWS